MSSGSAHQPVALTTSRSSALLASTWLSLSVADVTLDEKLKTVTPKSLFLRLCEQLARPEQELEKEDQEDLEMIRRRAVFLILRIWARQKWSFDWLHKNVPLKDQAHFFRDRNKGTARNLFVRTLKRTYANLYSKGIEEDANALLSDHHLFANLFKLRWEVQVGLKRHFVRKPPGPVVPTGSSGYQRFAGSLPPDWSAQNEIYDKMGKKETLQANIDKLKKMQSEIRCAIHLPSEEQLIGDLWEGEEQAKGLKIPLGELQAQISYELAEISMLQLKFNEAKTYFSKIEETLKTIDEKIFISFDARKLDGFSKACNSVLAKRSGQDTDPYSSKSAQELAEIMAEGIPEMNEMARQSVLEKIKSSTGRGKAVHLRSAKFY
ncbi:Oidioi.mRNA.OKI2018_I69.chr2.g4036.t1.cds [Oikopleura dioica]|uniref:Oidioi.mRNA.OKI2018_I69.chr2.g4036.t1.cds n=1 Tax=Oikopleura dioica TaxID=34765 RepID=A0ABN7SVQ1_OIKDI|nr:Oidioi.mRNA.OKI2018_I69.chr2.g4036.t1.cds [Oikopleura dioica]